MSVPLIGVGLKYQLDIFLTCALYLCKIMFIVSLLSVILDTSSLLLIYQYMLKFL